jgi:hypothetical protein
VLYTGTYHSCTVYTSSIIHARNLDKFKSGCRFSTLLGVPKKRAKWDDVQYGNSAPALVQVLEYIYLNIKSGNRTLPGRAGNMIYFAERSRVQVIILPSIFCSTARTVLPFCRHIRVLNICSTVACVSLVVLGETKKEWYK